MYKLYIGIYVYTSYRRIIEIVKHLFIWGDYPLWLVFSNMHNLLHLHNYGLPLSRHLAKPTNMLVFVICMVTLLLTLIKLINNLLVLQLIPTTV